MFDFSDKTAIITGSAGYLGRAVAKAFWQAGANVVLVDRAQDRLSGLFPDLLDSPRVFMVNSVDLLDYDAVERMVQDAVERFGRVDIVANVAGGFVFGDPIFSTSFDAWEKMMAINVHTAVNVCRAATPKMIEQGGGKIVNVAARAGLEAGSRMAAYSASKAAVIRLTESMAAELKKSNINVNCILPSTIDTEANRRSMPKADPSKWVAPEALADVILFLASEAARAINGAAIPVYG